MIFAVVTSTVQFANEVDFIKSTSFPISIINPGQNF